MKRGRPACRNGAPLARRKRSVILGRRAVDEAGALIGKDDKRFYTELPDGRIEHRADRAMLVLALLVIPAIVFEASVTWLRNVAWGLNVLVWIGFAAELAFVLTVSRHRLRTLGAHWLDAAIVVVSFPLFGHVLQSARALRLLRLTRLMTFGARANQLARELFSPTGSGTWRCWWCSWWWLPARQSRRLTPAMFTRYRMGSGSTASPSGVGERKIRSSRLH